MAGFNLEQSLMTRVQTSASNMATKLLTATVRTLVAHHSMPDFIRITARVAPQGQDFGFRRL